MFMIFFTLVRVHPSVDESIRTYEIRFFSKLRNKDFYIKQKWST